MLENCPEHLAVCPSLAYSLAGWFIETPHFSDQLPGLLPDDEYWGLQLALVLRPEEGWGPAYSLVYLLVLYPTSRQEDLTDEPASAAEANGPGELK